MGLEFCLDIFQIDHFQAGLDMSCSLLSLIGVTDLLVVGMEKVVLDGLFVRSFPGVLVRYIRNLGLERSAILRLIRQFSVFFLTNAVINYAEFVVHSKLFELRRA